MTKTVVFINPPWLFESAGIPSDEGLSQNLGIGYLAAVVERLGHTAVIIDALAEGIEQSTEVEHKGKRLYRRGLSYPEVAARISHNVDLIGITVPFTTLMSVADELTKVIKAAYPSIPLMVGGVYPSTLPDRAFKSAADFVVVGEGETPITRYLEGIPLEEIEGVWFRSQDVVRDNGHSVRVVDLDSLPLPARHLFPMERYVNWSPRGKTSKRTASIITSRGCPFRCAFCSVHPMCGYKWRARSPENVMQEIRALAEKHGIEHIEFEDDNLTYDPERALTLFTLIRESDLGLTWSTPNGVRLDTLTYPLVKQMKESGCSLITLAVESGDPDVLRMMRKKLDLEKVREVARWCVEVAIPTFCFFMVGFPGETRKRFENSLKFALELKDIGVEGFGVGITRAYPGTELGEECLRNGWLLDPNLDETIILGDYVGYTTTDFDEEELRNRLQEFRMKVNPQVYMEDKIRNSGILSLLNRHTPEWLQDRLRKPARWLINRI